MEIPALLSLGETYPSLFYRDMYYRGFKGRVIRKFLKAMTFCLAESEKSSALPEIFDRVM